MTELDHLARLQQVSANAPFNKWLDLRVESASPGRVQLVLDWRSEFGQYTGSLHAAIVAGLLDTACGFAASTMSGRVTASQISVRFLRPAVGATFLVTGEVVKPGRHQVFTKAELVTKDAPDKLLALAETMIIPLGD